MYNPLSYHTHAQLQVESIKDQVREALHTLARGTIDSLTEEQLKDFKKRKLISNVYASWEGSLVPLVTHILLLLNSSRIFYAMNFICHSQHITIQFTTAVSNAQFLFFLSSSPHHLCQCDKVFCCEKRGGVFN